METLTILRSQNLSLNIIKKIFIKHREKNFLLSKIANLDVINNKLTIKINPEFIFLSSLITKKILDENLGFRQERTQKKGELIFSLSPMTEEIRKNIIKEVKRKIETEFIFLKRERQKLRNLLKINDSFSDDERKRYEKEIDILINEYKKKLEKTENEKISSLER